MTDQELCYQLEAVWCSKLPALPLSLGSADRLIMAQAAVEVIQVHERKNLRRDYAAQILSGFVGRVYKEETVEDVVDMALYVTDHLIDSAR